MTRDPTDIRAEVARQQEADDQRRRQRLEELADLRGVMATQAGRRFVWKQLARTGLFRNPFDNSGSVTAFNCGKQALGQDLWKDLHSSKELIELWQKTQQEHAE